MTNDTPSSGEFNEDRQLAHAAIVQASINMNEFFDMDALRSAALSKES